MPLNMSLKEDNLASLFQVNNKLFRIPTRSIKDCENNGKYSSSVLDMLSTFKNG